MLSERKFENLVCLPITFCMFSNFLTFSSHLLPFELENFLGIVSQKSLRTLERESLNGMKKNHPIWSKLSLFLSR